ncbi:MAG: hypothetical protein WD512_19450, partial [Candidatus Paceibacterota bacterium]
MKNKNNILACSVLRLCLLVFVAMFFIFQNSFAQTVEIGEGARSYLCSYVNSKWIAGKYQKNEYISYKKLGKINQKKFNKTQKISFLNKANKFKKLARKRTKSCKSFCGEGANCLGQPVIEDIQDITVAATHSCILTANGKVKCWGYAISGALGYVNEDRIGDDETPAAVGFVDIGGTAVQLSSSGFHNCVLLDSGAVRCWGQGYWGQLGYGNTNSIGVLQTPASAGDVSLGGVATFIATGESHSCAILSNGKVRCWGHGNLGRLGYADSESVGDDETPGSKGFMDLYPIPEDDEVQERATQ